MVCAKHIAQPKWLNGSDQAKRKKTTSTVLCKKQHAVDVASTMQFRNIYNLVSFLFNLVSYALSMFPPHLVHKLCVCVSVCLCIYVDFCARAVRQCIERNMIRSYTWKKLHRFIFIVPQYPLFQMIPTHYKQQRITPNLQPKKPFSHFLVFVVLCKFYVLCITFIT